MTNLENLPEKLNSMPKIVILDCDGGLIECSEEFPKIWPAPEHFYPPAFICSVPQYTTLFKGYIGKGFMLPPAYAKKSDWRVLYCLHVDNWVRADVYEATIGQLPQLPKVFYEDKMPQNFTVLNRQGNEVHGASDIPLPQSIVEEAIKNKDLAMSYNPEFTGPGRGPRAT